MPADIPSRGVLAGARHVLWSTTALSAFAAAWTWYVPSALAQCAPAPTSGATVTCTGSPSSFAASDLASLTVNAQNASFNGAFETQRIGTLGITSVNSNFQAVNLTDIGNL